VSGLELHSINAGYGREAVLRDVTLSVGPGEAVAVLGANGAGKTTLLRTVAGFLPVSAGSILHGGKPLSGSSPSRRVREGIVLAAEGHEVVETLTVEENLALGAFRFWPRGSRSEVRRSREQAYEMFPALASKRGQLAGLLSGGQQQMLAIGRALMARPSVLLLDEPGLGLAPVVIDDIYERLAVLTGENLSMLIVEQNSDRAGSFCDRTYVMRLGELVDSSERGRLDEDRLRAAYFGEDGAG